MSLSMPLPVITNVYRCALNWQSGSQKSVNVMHVRRAASSASAVAAALDAWATAGLWGFEPTGTAVNNLVITPLDGTSASYTLPVTGAKWSGSAGVSEFFPAAAVVVKLTTLLRGRSQRGRLFLPWVAESKQTNGGLDVATQGTTQTAWNTFLGALISAGFPPVVASYLHSSATDVVAMTVETLEGTQRRRQSRNR